MLVFCIFISEAPLLRFSFFVPLESRPLLGNCPLLLHKAMQCTPIHLVREASPLQNGWIFGESPRGGGGSSFIQKMSGYKSYFLQFWLNRLSTSCGVPTRRFYYTIMFVNDQNLIFLAKIMEWGGGGGLTWKAIWRFSENYPFLKEGLGFPKYLCIFFLAFVRMHKLLQVSRFTFTYYIIM